MVWIIFNSDNFSISYLLWFDKGKPSFIHVTVRPFLLSVKHSRRAWRPISMICSGGTTSTKMNWDFFHYTNKVLIFIWYFKKSWILEGRERFEKSQMRNILCLICKASLSALFMKKAKMSSAIWNGIFLCFNLTLIP